MKTMTVEQLYDKLCSKAFQDPKNGDLHYNYFMFQYDATKEYDMLRHKRSKFPQLQKLLRKNHFTRLRQNEDLRY